VLLDQKRTKRMVKIVSIVAAIAFAGVIFVVLGVIVFGGGGGGNGAGDQLKAAQQLVQQNPRSAAAWTDLAAQYQAQGQTAQAIDAAQHAVSLAPNNYSGVQSLVALLSNSNQHAQAVVVLQRYTAKNATNADAFLTLGLEAERASRKKLAQLAYGRFLELAPQDANAPFVRDKLKTLGGGGTPTRATTTAAPTTTSTPATPRAPATPATP
jgi:tetratricopeptide (TPR) repeat protein